MDDIWQKERDLVGTDYVDYVAKCSLCKCEVREDHTMANIGGVWLLVCLKCAVNKHQ